uniref:NUDIX domain-containing protein n=1 Tax=Acetatifactor sp. TaxID=1872090 RepID=UPI0040574846
MTAIYLTCEEQILLLYRQGGRVVNNVWVASAGGHFEENELNDACACVLRELQEELHINEDMLDKLALRYVTLRRTEKEIRQNYYFYAELKNGRELELNSDEGRLQWFPIEEIKNLEMPFSAKFAMEHWLEIGRYNTKIYGGIADGTTVVFTELPAF